MKKILAIILAVMMLIPSFAMAENIVKIGVFEPASGDSGAGGKQEMLGMQYANKVAPTVTIGDTEYKVMADGKQINLYDFSKFPTSE